MDKRIDLTEGKITSNLIKLSIPIMATSFIQMAYNMADMMHIPVLGVVENFSYLECPDCGKKINVFGQSHVDEAAKELGIPVFGKLPVDPAYAEKADEGKFFEIDNPYLADGVEALKNL